MTTPTKTMLNVMTADRAMPDGCDTWGMRSVHPDLRSSRGFRWPFPGNWAECDFNLLTEHLGGCPQQAGDGLCVADTYAGMASGGIPASVLLLCAYSSHDVLGHETGKSRVARVSVVDLIDGAQLVRAYGSHADLSGAYLTGADLAGANLTGANLAGARGHVTAS